MEVFNYYYYYYYLNTKINSVSESMSYEYYIQTYRATTRGPSGPKNRIVLSVGGGVKFNDSWLH